MKKQKFILIGFLGSALAGSLSAATTVEQLLNRIEFQEQRSPTVRFTYQQETRFENGPQANGEGSVTIRKPDHVRIHQAKPEERLTVSDGKQTWVYTPAHKQAWKSKKDAMSVMFQGTVLPLENVAATLRNTYDLSIVSESTGTDKIIRIAAVPKDKSADGQLEMSFRSEDWIPNITIFRSSTAQVTTRVTNVEPNPEIKANDFEFVPLPGTDVIPF